MVPIYSLTTEKASPKILYYKIQTVKKINVLGVFKSCSDKQPFRKIKNKIIIKQRKIIDVFLYTIQYALKYKTLTPMFKTES